MSGGSYGYLYAKDADALFADPSELQEMTDRLAGLDWAADAAADAADLVAIIRTQKARVDAAMRRLADVFHAVEWWDSNDWGEDQVRAVLAEYRGETAPPAGIEGRPAPASAAETEVWRIGTWLHKVGKQVDEHRAVIQGDDLLLRLVADLAGLCGEVADGSDDDTDMVLLDFDAGQLPQVDADIEGAHRGGEPR